MIDDIVALIAFPDYGMENNGKLFIWDGENLTPQTFEQVSSLEKAVISVNFSTVASEILNHQRPMPKTVVDLQELIIAVSKEPKVSKIREEFSFGKLLKRFGLSDDTFKEFSKLNYSSKNFESDTLKQVGESMLQAFKVISRLASIRGEWERFIKVEVPVANALLNDLWKGVGFDAVRLGDFREQIEFDYYKALKSFSTKHDLPLEVPSNKNLEKILENAGFDLNNESIDYLLEFVSLKNGLGEDVQNLQKLKVTRDALNGISHKKSKSFPHVITQGTRTSRILLKSPALQNISKKYRSILVPASGKKYSYVDYDQFEVGIMGVLSGDPVLLELYQQNDLYQDMAKKLFDDNSKRKQAKKLFLSYAYGMTRKNLIKAAVNLGSTKIKAKDAFDQFSVFETWKKTIAKELTESRKIGTSMGNYFYLQHNHKPSSKDIRSGISQKVQGTGALIFKLALLEINKQQQFRVVLPMHDAVLVEHDLELSTNVIVTIFENTMTEFFDNNINGKASISDFSVSFP